jgi:hypothetical protein
LLPLARILPSGLKQSEVTSLSCSLLFDFLIWKDLKISATFDEFIADILELDSSNDNYKLTGDKFNYCLELFQAKRYLVILDIP